MLSNTEHDVCRHHPPAAPSPGYRSLQEVDTLGTECLMAEAFWARNCLEEVVSLAPGFGFRQTWVWILTLSLNSNTLLGRSHMPLWPLFPPLGNEALMPAEQWPRPSKGPRHRVGMISVAQRRTLYLPKQILPQPTSWHGLASTHLFNLKQDKGYHSASLYSCAFSCCWIFAPCSFFLEGCSPHTSCPFIVSTHLPMSLVIWKRTLQGCPGLAMSWLV